ncbi:hypothetical protein EIP91_004328 [Steccherinum ochraceum]|uniref:DUF6532 domain-containing protein n=1 Tax=Steccherinum ochraceum TaxID=92696 RepID=A0A4R0RHH3_9APHY|nr:hypothetical protein EIP91_004328 [Steccherinum ochraceum]
MCATDLSYEIRVSEPEILKSKLSARRPKPQYAVAGPSPSTPTKKSSKARITDHTPTSRAIFHKANTIFRVDLATREAFPDDALTHAQTLASWRQACEEMGDAFEPWKERDGSVIKSIVGQRTSQLRGELVGRARAQVANIYELKPDVNLPEKVKELVEMLTKDGKAFTYGDPIRSTGLFANSIIPRLIADQWLSGAASKAEGLIYHEAFNPVPAPLIALVASAVFCALKDFDTGSRCDADKNPFAGGSVYEDNYRIQLTRLEKWRAESPAFFEFFRKQLYEKALKISGKKKEAEVVIEETPIDYAAEAALAGFALPEA